MKADPVTPKYFCESCNDRTSVVQCDKCNKEQCEFCFESGDIGQPLCKECFEEDLSDMYNNTYPDIN